MPRLNFIKSPTSDYIYYTEQALKLLKLRTFSTRQLEPPPLKQFINNCDLYLFDDAETFNNDAPTNVYENVQLAWLNTRDNNCYEYIELTNILGLILWLAIDDLQAI